MRTALHADDAYSAPHGRDLRPKALKLQRARFRDTRQVPRIVPGQHLP